MSDLRGLADGRSAERPRPGRRAPRAVTGSRWYEHHRSDPGPLVGRGTPGQDVAGRKPGRIDVQPGSVLLPVHRPVRSHQPRDRGTPVGHRKRGRPRRRGLRRDRRQSHRTRGRNRGDDGVPARSAGNDVDRVSRLPTQDPRGIQPAGERADRSVRSGEAPQPRFESLEDHPGAPHFTQDWQVYGRGLRRRVAVHEQHGAARRHRSVAGPAVRIPAQRGIQLQAQAVARRRCTADRGRQNDRERNREERSHGKHPFRADSRPSDSPAAHHQADLDDPPSKPRPGEISIRWSCSGSMRGKHSTRRHRRQCA